MSGDVDDASEPPQRSDAGTPNSTDALDQAPWPLRRATQRWLRRGYTVRYSDPFLTQLVRRTGMGWVGWALVGLSAPCFGIALWLLLRALQRRGWHVVSITITPEGRVLSHRQWTRSEPT